MLTSRPRPGEPGEGGERSQRHAPSSGQVRGRAVADLSGGQPRAGPVAVTIRLSRAPYHPSQDRMPHGYISNFWDMIALQFWQRVLMASATAGFEAVPDRECC